MREIERPAWLFIACGLTLALLAGLVWRLLG